LEAFNFQYNISFIDPPLGGFSEILPSVMIVPSGQSPSGNIITSGNISPNPPSGGSINDKCTQHINVLVTKFQRKYNKFNELEIESTLLKVSEKEIIYKTL
jgi:hypothetical protein